jgi:phage terminase small subunit
MSGKPLSPKQRRFVAEYLKDQNGTQAAIRAGYAPKAAQEQSSDLLSKPMVRAAVDTELAKIQEKAGVNQERILNALLSIAEVDPRKLFNKDGTLKEIHQISDDVASTIASIESDDVKGHVRKIKFWDKTRALELLGKHLKMFSEKLELSDAAGAPVIIQFMPADYDSAKDRKSADHKGL